MAGWIKIPLGMEVGLSPGDFVLDGDAALPSPKMGTEPPPQLSAHFYCGQTAAIPLHASRCHPLGMEAHAYCDQTVAHLSN